MEKCENRHVRKTRAFGAGVPIVRRHANRAFREVRRSARGSDPWANRARRGPAAMKSEVIVEASEGDGQVARACEDRGLKAQTWISGGVAVDHALPLALRQLVSKTSSFSSFHTDMRRVRFWGPSGSKIANMVNRN